MIIKIFLYLLNLVVVFQKRTCFFLYQRVFKLLYRLLTGLHECERRALSQDTKGFLRSLIFSRIFKKSFQIKNDKDLNSADLLTLLSLMSNVDTDESIKILENTKKHKIYYEIFNNNENKISSLLNEKNIYHLPILSNHLCSSKKISDISHKKIDIFFNTTLFKFFFLRKLLWFSSKEIFNKNNENHKNLLDILWKKTYYTFNKTENTPEKLDCVSQDWLLIGFQGKAPDTDFRGTGMFGLKQLVSFVEKSRSFYEVYHTATDEKKWYFFAAAGINITGKILELFMHPNSNDYYLRFFDISEKTCALVDDNNNNNISLDHHKEKIIVSSRDWELMFDYNFSDNDYRDNLIDYKKKFFFFLDIVYEKTFNAFNKEWLKQKTFSFMNFNSLFEEFIKNNFFSVVEDAFEAFEKKFVVVDEPKKSEKIIENSKIKKE